jgi:hypothetical protein
VCVCVCVCVSVRDTGGDVVAARGILGAIDCVGLVVQRAEQLVHTLCVCVCVCVLVCVCVFVCVCVCVFV